MLNNIFATFFYLGRIPKAPGTWGSLGGLVFIYLMFFYWYDAYSENITFVQYSVLTLALFLAGCLSATYYDRAQGTKDAKQIVIDEVVGMMITCLPIVYMFTQSTYNMAFSGWLLSVIGFALFRFFDVLKPWPISLADRKVRGGLGVMLDDVIAGIFAAGCLYAVAYGLYTFGIDVF